MNVKSDKFNCYIEGIRIPLLNSKIRYERNNYSYAMIRIPLGKIVNPIMFANALIQVTYIESTTEKKVFDGMCVELDIAEEVGVLEITAQSLWSSLNLNTTLDYMSPKKYGLQNLEEGNVIYIGNEDKTTISLSELSIGAELSSRYFLVDESEVDIFEIDPDDAEARKIFYITNRLPFAERYANTIFDDMAYSNFFLTQAHVDRFNLLNKSDGFKRGERLKTVVTQALEQTLDLAIRLDPSRSGVFYELFKVKVNNGVSTSAAGSTDISSKVEIGSVELNEAFMTEIKAVANRLNMNVIDLLLIMQFESNLNPKAQNPTSNATGLIQFMPSTAISLGTTVGAIYNMTSLQQLPYVEKYFRGIIASTGPLKNLQDLCMGVFYPTYVGKPANTVFPSKVQRSNPGIKTIQDYVNLVLSRARRSGAKIKVN